MCRKCAGRRHSEASHGGKVQRFFIRLGQPLRVPEFARISARGKIHAEACAMSRHSCAHRWQACAQALQWSIACLLHSSAHA